MITRAFLLLLAMLTGLTAAQAGNVAQAGHGVAGWSASNAESGVAEAAFVKSEIIFSPRSNRRIVCVQVELCEAVYTYVAPAVALSAFYKQDRLRL